MDKVKAYFELIEKHILQPIEKTDLSKSCTATIVLIFSAFDGLGKLLHPSVNAKSAVRFKYFLKYLGNNYIKREKELWSLRNSLMHNGISNISFMSATQMGESEHLKYSSPDGFVFVSSSKLTKDFRKTFEKLKVDLFQEETKIQEIAERLCWIEDDIYSYWGPYSTCPGPIAFIDEKNKTVD